MEYLYQLRQEAYNLSVNGPIFIIGPKKIALTPISPFRPRRWKGKLISDRSKIIINNLQRKRANLCCSGQLRNKKY